MPLARIVRSAAARRDIGEIHQYLAQEAGLEIADTVLARITEALYPAADRPLVYRRRNDFPGTPRRINVLELRWQQQQGSPSEPVIAF